MNFWVCRTDKGSWLSLGCTPEVIKCGASWSQLNKDASQLVASALHCIRLCRWLHFSIGLVFYCCVESILIFGVFVILLFVCRVWRSPFCLRTSTNSLPQGGVQLALGAQFHLASCGHSRLAGWTCPEQAARCPCWPSKYSQHQAWNIIFANLYFCILTKTSIFVLYLALHPRTEQVNAALPLFFTSLRSKRKKRCAKWWQIRPVIIKIIFAYL